MLIDMVDYRVLVDYCQSFFWPQQSYPLLAVVVVAADVADKRFVMNCTVS